MNLLLTRSPSWYGLVWPNDTNELHCNHCRFQMRNIDMFYVGLNCILSVYHCRSHLPIRNSYPWGIL